MSTPAARARLLAALALLALFVVPLRDLPRAAAGEPGATPFLQVRIDSVTPDVVTTTSDPIVTVTGPCQNVGDRPVRDVDGAPRARRCRHVVGWAAHQPRRQRRPVPARRRLHHRRTGTAPRTARSRSPVLPAALRRPIRRWTSTKPGVYPVLVNVNGTPDYGEPARLDDARFLLPVLGVPPDPAADTAPTRWPRSVPPDTIQARAADDAVAAGRPAAAGRGRARRHHTGAADRRRPRDVAGPRRPAGHPAVGRRVRDQPAGRPRRRGAPARCVWPSTPTCWSPSTR